MNYGLKIKYNYYLIVYIKIASPGGSTLHYRYIRKGGVGGEKRQSCKSTRRSSRILAWLEVREDELKRKYPSRPPIEQWKIEGEAVVAMCSGFGLELIPMEYPVQTALAFLM